MSIIVHNQDIDSDIEQGEPNITTTTNSSQFKINTSSFHKMPIQYLDIPRMGSEELKMMYRGFRTGMTPVDIIAKYGYHPDIVEVEYERFLRSSDRDVNVLVRSIVEDCSAYITQPQIESHVEKYRKQGYLTNDEILELLELRFKCEWQFRLTLLTFDPDEVLPTGLLKLKCNQCKKPISGAIVDGNSEIGKNILDQYTNVRCPSCIYHVTLDEFNEMRLHYLQMKRSDQALQNLP